MTGHLCIGEIGDVVQGVPGRGEYFKRQVLPDDLVTGVDRIRATGKRRVCGRNDALRLIACPLYSSDAAEEQRRLPL